MKHNEALENMKFDTRLIDWNIKRGVITETDLKAHLTKLGDLGAKAKTLEIENNYEDNEDFQ